MTDSKQYQGKIFMTRQHAMTSTWIAIYINWIKKNNFINVWKLFSLGAILNFADSCCKTWNCKKILRGSGKICLLANYNVIRCEQLQRFQLDPYLRAWLQIWTWDDQEQFQQVARAELKLGTTGLRVQLADHLASASERVARERMFLFSSSPIYVCPYSEF